MSNIDRSFDEEVDLLIIGAGAGGMTAALTASMEGLSVLICEKTSMVGGTTSTSGGTVWVPGTSLSEKAGVPDTIEEADRFLQHVVGNRGGDERRRAFLESGRSAIDALVTQTDVQLVAAAAHPDYLDGPGSAYGGRALAAIEFDGRVLGKEFARVRPPRDVFMGLGGMMVGRYELPALLKPFASVGNFRTTMRIVLRYFADRLTYSRGTRVLMGNALVGRLFLSLKKRNVPIWFDSALGDFIREGDRVVGTVVSTPDGERRIKARRGVVLATGGVAWNRKLRDEFFPAEIAQPSQTPVTNTGDGIMAAFEKLGAKLDNGHDSPALWMPCSFLKKKDGTESIWPHILLDRAKPGLLAVGSDGQRFVNEADSYHDFCMGMIKAKLSEAWLVVDANFMQKYGLGLVLPGARGLSRLLRTGYLFEGKNVEDLAGKIGVDAKGLSETIAKYNGYAKTSDDLEFHRGHSVVNRFNGDEAAKPNPCLAPLINGPLYAVKVMPLDLAGSAGLVCDVNSLVLDQQDKPIEGLYVCGNDATSIFRGTYPGPGTTLGPAMVFGWRIARHAAGKPMTL